LDGPLQRAELHLLHDLSGWRRVRRARRFGQQYVLQAEDDLPGELLRHVQGPVYRDGRELHLELRERRGLLELRPRDLLHPEDDLSGQRVRHVERPLLGNDDYVQSERLRNGDLLRRDLLLAEDMQHLGRPLLPASPGRVRAPERHLPHLPERRRVHGRRLVL
jgi:hypothetical protein